MKDIYDRISFPAEDIAVDFLVQGSYKKTCVIMSYASGGTNQPVLSFSGVMGSHIEVIVNHMQTANIADANIDETVEIDRKTDAVEK
jgi:hypothetical protein